MSATNESGLALVIALFATTLMLALGGALVLLTSSETVIAANFRSGHEAFYAADAAFERALADLRGAVDWTTVLNGAQRSSFVDGAPSGIRALVDGSRIDLAQITNLANCDKVSPCTDAEIATATSERPWGTNNPRWTLFAYGPLADSLGAATVQSPFYVVAFVADDPSENDGDAMRDGATVGGLANPGAGVVLIRAEAFGPRNAHRVIEATVAKLEIPPALPGGAISTDLRVISWREVR
jgi:hypothetical protein